MSWGDRTTYHGKPVNHGTKALLIAANKMLATPTFGGEREDLTITQGSYNRGGVSASAGTHDGGGAFDATPFNDKNREHVFRLLGGAGWIRPTISGLWSRHIHVIVDGDGTASAGAKRQVTKYHERRDGLASNHPDPGYRMLVFPLFVDPDKATGKPGKRYCTRAAHVYAQPTTSAKNLGAVGVGDVLDAVAVVNVGGEYWFVTADGKCGHESNFSRTAPGTSPAPTPETQPPAATPTEPITATIRVATMNVISDYRANFPGRVHGLNAMRDKMHASIVMTQESGSYADGDLLSGAFGINWRNVLHGDDRGILTCAVHWDGSRYRLLDEGKFQTTGPHHDWATWAALRHLDSDLVFMPLATHPEYRPKGSNRTHTSYDDLREAQIASALRQAKKKAIELAARYHVKHVPIILGADCNGDRNDAYDGPGIAAKAAGFVDSETTAKTHVNGGMSTFNGGGSFRKGDRLDRIFVETGTPVGEQITVYGHPYTDHNGVAISATLRNEGI